MGPGRVMMPEETGAKRVLLAWRLLIAFWALIVVCAAAGAGMLAVLGPPPEQLSPAASAGTPHEQPVAAGANTVKLAPAAAETPVSPPPPRAIGAPIPAPDPALLDTAAANAPAALPRIGPDGHAPMQVYAAGFDASDKRPKIAVLVAGIGQSASESEDALRSLPGTVSFAVSPYTPSPEALLPDIRAKGHEFFVSIPMEPQGYPVNDEGNHSLLIGGPTRQNADRLAWTLTRFAGYVGATNALDGMRGERFTASTTQMQAVLQELAARGLMFVDDSPETDEVPFGSIPHLMARRVDIVIDSLAVRAEIEWKLALLEEKAHDNGAAIGLALLPRPVTIAVLAKWAGTLGSRGFALAPVSAVVRMPAPPQPAVVRTDVSR